MIGYPRIGNLYLLPEQECSDKLLWVVIENNSNDKTSTLLVVEDCPKYGMSAKVDAEWLSKQEAIAPVLEPDTEIVVENGLEFIKGLDVEKGKTKLLKPIH